MGADNLARPNSLFHGLGSLDALSPSPLANRPGGASLLGGPRNPSQPARAPGGLSSINWLAIAAEKYRRRAEWNDRFSHWERSESDAETQRIVRARDMVQGALSRSSWLRACSATIIPQGSFTNRTNTRLEADIDLRVQFPLLKVEYGQGVDPQEGRTRGGYYDAGVTYEKFNNDARVELLTTLFVEFGRENVRNGNKAIRVDGLAGSRGEVDVVPAFTFHRVMGTTLLGQYRQEGIAILGNDGGWTANFPDQHLANGRAKRERTSHQFKKVVRIVKRLRGDMESRGLLAKRPPSFLVECLIYIVEDSSFVWSTDDRYDRVRRVLGRVSDILANPMSAYAQTEINGIKPLFSADQAWTLDEARAFVRAALIHLGDC